MCRALGISHREVLYRCYLLGAYSNAAGYDVINIAVMSLYREATPRLRNIQRLVWTHAADKRMEPNLETLFP